MLMSMFLLFHTLEFESLPGMCREGKISAPLRGLVAQPTTVRAENSMRIWLMEVF